MNSDHERLDAFLSSHASPDNCMMLSDLDGFLHGTACSPAEIPTHTWMLRALGGSVRDVPDWVIEVTAGLYADIQEGLALDPPRVEPVFWQAKEGHMIAMDWCEGFMEAVKLRAGAWNVVVLTKEGSELMLRILVHLLDENGNSHFGVPQEELDEMLDEAAKAIPEVVPELFKLAAIDRAEP